MNNNNKLILPCLRGKMGDWIYYVTLLKFEDVAKRVSMVPDIHKSQGLSDLIQREVSDRTKGIVDYLKSQDQRFFNSLILGVYGGHPKWHEISIQENNLDNLPYEESENVELKEEDINSLSASIGVLTLDGDEKIFAIDGQHRTKAIKDALAEKDELKNDEISAIFVAHKKTEDGEIRTRRLFSTLNRYAKPVSKNEIIAIDEEDNCAIITRNIVENFELLQDKILFNKTRSVSISNTSAFTNIIVLYDFITTLLTNSKVFGVSVDGKDHKSFTHRRETDEQILLHQEYVEILLNEIFERIPDLSSFIEENYVDRRSENTSLVFRPVGQNVFYSVLKVAIDKGKRENAISFFSEMDFSLSNDTWKKIFTDSETGRMKTDKTMQKYAFQLILKHLGINIRLSEKDKEVHNNFNINYRTLMLN